jgi:hypothetical protein
VRWAQKVVVILLWMRYMESAVVAAFRKSFQVSEKRARPGALFSFRWLCCWPQPRLDPPNAAVVFRRQYAFGGQCFDHGWIDVHQLALPSTEPSRPGILESRDSLLSGLQWRLLWLLWLRRRLWLRLWRLVGGLICGDGLCGGSCGGWSG